MRYKRPQMQIVNPPPEKLPVDPLQSAIEEYVHAGASVEEAMESIPHLNLNVHEFLEHCAAYRNGFPKPPPKSGFPTMAEKLKEAFAKSNEIETPAELKLETKETKKKKFQGPPGLPLLPPELQMELFESIVQGTFTVREAAKYYGVTESYIYHVVSKLRKKTGIKKENMEKKPKPKIAIQKEIQKTPLAEAQKFGIVRQVKLHGLSGSEVAANYKVSYDVVQALCDSHEYDPIDQTRVDSHKPTAILEPKTEEIKVVDIHQPDFEVKGDFVVIRLPKQKVLKALLESMG